MSAMERAELLAFAAREARLLDERRYDEWLALFADDGRYWVPLMGAAQTEGDAHNSLADEDRLLLGIRIERLKRPGAHSESPPTHGQHVLQASELESADDAAGLYELFTPFLYAESRGERRLLLSGTYRHRLSVVDGRLRIRLKRVDLLDAGSALPAIQLFP